MVDDNRWAQFSEKVELVEKERQRLRDIWVHPKADNLEDKINQLLKRHCLKRGEWGKIYYVVLKMTYEILKKILVLLLVLMIRDHKRQSKLRSSKIREGYINRQQEEIEKQLRNESAALPIDIDYKHGEWIYQMKSLPN